MVISHKTQGNAKIPAPKTVSLTAGVTASPHLFISTPNPLKYTDPDGKLIKATGDDGETYIWDNEKNQFYSGSEDNRNYDIKDEFIKTVQSDLRMIEYSLGRANDESAISEYNKMADDRDYAVTITRAVGGNGYSDNARITYDPNRNRGRPDASGNTKHPAFINLAHELGHAKNHFLLGTEKYLESKHTKATSPGFPSLSEQSAVGFENAVRLGAYYFNENHLRARY
jgi:hypothetical protein